MFLFFKERKMKKFSYLLAALVCAAALFSGCAKKDEGVTLTLWHIYASDTETMKPAFEKVVAEYQASHPEIKLVLDATENEAYKTKIRAAVSANEAADVFLYWSGGRLKGFVDAGAVLPLDDYLDADTKSRILPGTTGNMTFNGKLYALPFTLAVGTFFVNQELFDQNGLTVPATWDELVNVCQAFLAKGITPFTVGARDVWPIAMYFDLMTLHQAGYQATNAALTKTGPFNIPDVVEAARKLQQLVDMGAFGNGAMGLSRDESEVPFYEGKVPMYVNGSWTIGNVNGKDSKVRGKVKIYPFPALGPNGGTRDLTGGAADNFAVNAKTKHPKEAVELLTYLTENFTAELYQSGGGLPTWQVTADESRVDPLTRELVDLLKNVDTYTLWWDVMLEGKDAQLYLENLSSLFAKQITPEQFAEIMQGINR
jgi:raffinose/stachyose/melibiose transport system substrate-binding protein